MKKSDLIEGKAMRGPVIFALAALVIATVFLCRAENGTGYAPTIYPSIFWHNNQWESYENGQWVPYRGSANNDVLEPEPQSAPEPLPGSETIDTNIYPVPYGWGFIGARAINGRHQPALAHFREKRGRHERTVNGFGQPNVGLGRTTIGIGKPNVGIGQTTIGIGKPNVGIGQPNLGIGQRNVGIGQTTIGIGQPNAGVGQPTISVGRVNAGIGQQSLPGQFRGR